MKRIKERAMQFMLLALGILFLLPAKRVEAEDSFNLFARVDVRVERERQVAVDVMANKSGTIYGYRVEAKGTAPSLTQVLKSDEKQKVSAGVENTLMFTSYMMQCECGKNYDFYFAFVDSNGKQYGLYSVLNKKISNFPAGDGTLNNPYQIWTERHLYNLYACTGKKDIHIKVMQNIDMTKSTYKGSMTDYASSFLGTLDGNAKVIKGLNGRLFYGIGESGMVHNLHFYKCTADGRNGLMAISNKGTIKSCSIQDCNIIGGDGALDIGGFVGSNSGTIKRCEARNIYLKGAYQYVGGIAGSNSGTIESCYSEVSAYALWAVGGVTGSNRGKGKIYTCLSNPVYLSSKSEEGGVAGVNDASSGLISACISLYLPVNPEKKGHGSIVGSGGNASTTACIGGVSYIPLPPINSEDEAAMKAYEELLKDWMMRNGAIQTPYSFNDPITDYIAINFVNIAEFTSLHFAYKESYANETSAYQKVNPLTQLSSSTSTLQDAPKRTTITKLEKSDNSVVISWKSVSEVSGYEVYRSTKKDGSYTKIKVVTGTQYTSTGLKKGTNYYFKIRTYKTSKGKKIYGTYSSIKSVKL